MRSKERSTRAFDIYAPLMEGSVFYFEITTHRMGVQYGINRTLQNSLTFI